jgi:5-methyltetrahydrofolate--homocysteine methyltransferase
MIIIGEKINSTLKDVKAAIETGAAGFIQELAKKQTAAGAVYLDVNAGMFVHDEPEKLEWLIQTIQETIDTPFSFDSPNPKAIERALRVNQNGQPVINSITGEKARFDPILPLAVQYKTRIIALCMDDNGMPETVGERVTIGERLIAGLNQEGIPLDDIFIDPMVRPIGTGSHYGVVAIETIRAIKNEFPEVHIACGLSNISFGIPARKLMNQAFLIAAMTAGMDGAIMNPLDKQLMALLYAAEALLGIDDFCMNFIGKYRKGELET